MSTAHIRLDRLDYLPPSLILAHPRDVLSIFPNPTLITLNGGKGPPLWLTTLLHGNETTSFDVLSALAERYRDSRPPRSLSIFVGNVDATAAGVRYLPGQPDFNRIWEGGEGPYHDLVSQVAEEARRQSPFASIDIHNNTGANPLYGCVNALRPADLQLAAMFADLGVYYRTPPTTQSVAFSRFCPAITIECGKSGDVQGFARALDLVERVMELDEFAEVAPGKQRLRLYRTIGAMVVDPEASLEFAPGQADVMLDPAFEQCNFHDLSEGYEIARCQVAKPFIQLIGEHGEDLSAEYLDCSDGRIALKRAATPAMITGDLDIIRQDCLGYLMEPLDLGASGKTA